MSVCRSCGAEIVWALTASGKRMPLDAQSLPLPPGRFILSGDDPPVATPLRVVTSTYVSHFATCPNASQHRKKEER